MYDEAIDATCVTFKSVNMFKYFYQLENTLRSFLSTYIKTVIIVYAAWHAKGVT